jgi:hypothetical protein
VIKNLSKGPLDDRQCRPGGECDQSSHQHLRTDIDSHDCVIRINQGAFVPLDSRSTGVRTDVLFMTLPGYCVG